MKINANSFPYVFINLNDLVLVKGISAIIHEYSAQYEHIVTFGNFNTSVEDSLLQYSMQIYGLPPFTNEPTFPIS